MLKTALTNHMLHAAGILFRCFWIDTCLRQQAGKEAVLLIGLLGYLPAHIGQAEKEVLVHGEETALLQDSHCMTYARLGNPKMSCYICGAHHSFFFLKYQYGLQIVFTGGME